MKSKTLKALVATICFVLSFASLVGCTTPGTPADPTKEPAGEEQPTEEPAPTELPAPEPIDAEYAADFTVSHTFAQYMVLQRNEFIRVWGWAEESENGKKVTVSFLDMTVDALIENGEWCATLYKKLPAMTEGNTLRVYTDKTSVEFEDVLVGDVYIVTGQSNAAYPLDSYFGYKTAEEEGLDSSDFDSSLPIRLCQLSQNNATGLKRGTTDTNKDIKSKKAWKIAKRTNAGQFSAIGYLFGYNFVKLTDAKVPVGLIHIDGNGRPLGAFVPNEVAEKYKTDVWSDSKNYYVTFGVNAEWGRFLYNEYFAPFERTAIAGMIWYQGESDLQENCAVKYSDVFTALVEYMRGTHNLVNRDFPVYFIEFPPMYTAPSGYHGSQPWAFMDVGKIRAIMGGMVSEAKNIYQVQSGDAWYDREFWNNLHPNCKFPQALRAAKIAAAHLGEGGVTMENASGPIIDKIEFSSDKKKITITYKNVGDGLKTSDGGSAVKGFYPAVGPYNFKSSTDLTATITSANTIELKSSSALEGFVYHAITTESYGNEITLCNSAGIPAGAYWYYKE